MEGEAEALYLQLHKLSAITSEEGIDRILTTLWKTRKTGLQSTQKSSIQALLNLPSPTQLDPNSLTRSTDSNHAKANLLPTFASFPSFVSTPMWLHQDDTVTNFNHNQLGVSTPVIVDSSVAPLGPMQFQRDAGPPTNLGSIPCLKSMTWTMEKSNSVPGNRVAVISLKLQDYNKSPSGEIEVKFQLTRDILEAMLRSLTYIGEQLSNLAGTSSGPAQKKQKQ
ncbi:protein FAR1-RELATED SEQUENCE 3-like isoform X4 [Mangifera indica]|uniref:protein FAR1-RELATED SEQUENCE 3-like isoform X4 n=1 Tax=Mangifera indica TaxID=29780 RepID=UPI001CF9E016|nr:protein FAR1-RELATED SEQUENCE 3-like isoform X4 [Mangifera indica]